jgi:hypothetical protein
MAASFLARRDDGARRMAQPKVPHRVGRNIAQMGDVQRSPVAEADRRPSIDSERRQSKLLARVSGRGKNDRSFLAPVEEVFR